jgi:Thioredoxin like C-terminal domain
VALRLKAQNSLHLSRRTYTSPASPSLNQWGLVGSWNVGPEAAVLQAAPCKVVFRFHARDLNIILAPAKDGKPVRFKLTLDGAPRRQAHGMIAGPSLEPSHVATSYSMHFLVRAVR